MQGPSVGNTSKEESASGGGGGIGGGNARKKGKGNGNGSGNTSKARLFWPGGRSTKATSNTSANGSALTAATTHSSNATNGDVHIPPTAHKIHPFSNKTSRGIHAVVAPGAHDPVTGMTDASVVLGLPIQGGNPEENNHGGNNRDEGKREGYVGDDVECCGKKRREEG